MDERTIYGLKRNLDAEQVKSGRRVVVSDTIVDMAREIRFIMVR